MSDYFIFCPVCVTRGHSYKLFVHRTVVNTRKHYYCVRVIEPWNNKLCYGLFQLTEIIKLVS